jgi:DedD protein
VQRPASEYGGATQAPVGVATAPNSAADNEASAAGKADAGKPPTEQDGASEEGAKATRSASAQERRPARGPHLQAGVFMQAANAQALKATLEAQGLPVYIESRVHIGPFRDRKEAERMREKLKEMGVATVLVVQ